MEPVFVGSHPAIDFLNTTFSPQGTPLEVIGDGEALLQWLIEAKYLDAAAASRIRRRHGEKALDLAAAEARRVRSWMSEWLERWRIKPNVDYTTELRRLNGLLGRGHSYRQAVATRHGVQIVEREHLLSIDELIALLATPFAQLISRENPEYVKRCAGAECTLLFLDKTKAHRRVFCSASACGNRAKVAAFRERRKQQSQ